MFNIVLLEPQIHTNTGSIGRMCVNTDCVLHLIKPFGFIIDDKHLRRAGLDYWARLDVRIYEDLSEFYAKNAVAGKRSFFATTKTDTLYFEASFEPGDYLFFGISTAGAASGISSLRSDASTVNSSSSHTLKAVVG